MQQSQAARHLNRNRASNAHWADETTYEPVLAGVLRLFLIAPTGVADPSAQMTTFLQHALQSGVQRVILLSSSLITPDSQGLGTVHKAIQEQIPEWAVLRPTWFMQNFVENHYYAASIKNEGVIVTATGDGRVGFVDVGDIAEVGLRALVDKQAHNTDHLITGPQALSYAEVANILSVAFERYATFSRSQRKFRHAWLHMVSLLLSLSF